MPQTVTLAVRDIRAAAEDGVLTDKARAAMTKVIKGVDAERGVTVIDNVRAEDAEAQVATVLKLLNRHLRRYPRTDCAFALSLAAYFRGETSGEYLP